MRATSYINQQIQEILKEAAGPSVGFKLAMDQAWTGDHVALEAFFKLLNDVPELQEIGVERPSSQEIVPNSIIHMSIRDKSTSLRRK